MKSALFRIAILVAAAHTAHATTLFYASVTNQYDDDPPGNIVKYDSSGTKSVWNINWDADITLFDPQGLAFDSHANLFVNDGDRIYKIDAAGNGTTFTLKPNVYYAYGLAIDAADNVYAIGASGFDYAIYRYNSSGTQTAMWVSPGGAYTGLQVGPDGALYTTDLFSNSVIRVDTTDGTRSLYATVNSAYDLTFDSTGNLYVIGNSSLNRVYKVAAAGAHAVTTYISSGLNQTSGIAMDKATGKLYIGNQTGGGTNSVRVKPPATGAVLFGTNLQMEQKVNFIAMAPTIAPVPEPGAWGVALGVFLIGFALLRRRSISRKSS